MFQIENKHKTDHKNEYIGGTQICLLFMYLFINLPFQFLIFILYRSKVYLQCFVSFKYTTK